MFLSKGRITKLMAHKTLWREINSCALREILPIYWKQQLISINLCRVGSGRCGSIQLSSIPLIPSIHFHPSLLPRAEEKKKRIKESWWNFPLFYALKVRYRFPLMLALGLISALCSPFSPLLSQDKTGGAQQRVEHIDVLYFCESQWRARMPLSIRIVCWRTEMPPSLPIGSVQYALCNTIAVQP